MSTLHEGRHPAEFILSEAAGQRSRETVAIAESQDIEPGGLLCKVAVVADVVAAASAAAGNTGDATIAMGDPGVTSKVKDGRYKGIATDATHVAWEDPAGKKIGISTHGDAFAKGGISLTITAGDTANVAGDEFYVDVAADAVDFQHVAYDPDGDGTIAGIAIYPASTGAGETVKIAAMVRAMEANGHCLAWPDGITDAQKADAEQALADLGIIVRN